MNSLNPELVKLAHQYKFGKALGQGGFATVYIGTRISDNQTVALKCIDVDNILTERKIKKQDHQIAILQGCSNPHIVKCYGCIKNKNWKIIVLEYCKDGSLFDKIFKENKIAEYQAINIIEQLIIGFAYLHKAKIIHRDLKSENILIHKGKYKIADFGLAKTKQQITRESSATTVGTCFSMAPEVSKSQPYGIEAEMWSLGVIYYEMLMGYPPFARYFDEISIQQLYKTIDQNDFSQKSKDFLKSVFVINPKDRFQWIQLYKSYNNKTGLFTNSNKQINHYHSIQKYKQKAFKKIKPEETPLVKQTNNIPSMSILSTKENLNQVNNQQDLIVTLKSNKSKNTIPLIKSEQKISQNDRQQIKLENNFQVVKFIYENTTKKICDYLNSCQLQKSHKFDRGIYYFFILIDSQMLKIMKENNSFLYTAETSLQQIKQYSDNNTTVYQFNKLNRDIVASESAHRNLLRQIFSSTGFFEIFESNGFTKEDYQKSQKYFQYNCNQSEHIKQTQKAFQKIQESAPQILKQFFKNIKIFISNDYGSRIFNRIK